MSELTEEPVLTARNLHRSFVQGGDRVQVLRGVNLELSRGQRTGILGRSGSGKSTLLHLLGGLDRADDGQVLLRGKDMQRLDGSARARLRNQALGFVYQFHHLLADFSAAENAAMPLLIAGWSYRRALAAGSELLVRVGLGDRLRHRPFQLSGGERQRVALARALVHRPDCVLADEPTGNLDDGTAEAVSQLMLELARDMGTGFIVATHNASLADTMDVRLVLHDGLLHETD